MLSDSAIFNPQEIGLEFASFWNLLTFDNASNLQIIASNRNLHISCLSDATNPSA